MINRRILVVGGAGSIGQEIVRQLAPQNKVFILDNNETGTFDLREELRWKGYWVHSRTGDIRNDYTVFDTFSEFHPQIVISCAALKHVTPCEEYPEEATSVNVEGTLKIVRECKREKSFEKMVFISTDKAVRASCVMGATKKLAEVIIKTRGKGFVAVRFGNVMHSRGSVLEIWEKQFKANEPLTITHPDMERYIMEIPEAVKLTIQTAEKAKGGEVRVLDMGPRIKIIDLKNKIYGEKRSEER